MVIRKVKNKQLWNIYSERTGRKLNKKPFRSKAKAEKRLEQIEYFKKRGRRHAK